MLSDLWPWSNTFIGIIARPSPGRETKWQKEFDMAYWLWRFRNSPYIASRTDSNPDVSFPNTGRKTKF